MGIVVSCLLLWACDSSALHGGNAEEVQGPDPAVGPPEFEDPGARPVLNLSRPGVLDRDAYIAGGGTDYFLSAKGGNDQFTGTSPRYPQFHDDGPTGPWTSVAKVNRTLGPGDRAFFNSGVHVGEIRPARSGEAGKPIQYIGWMPSAYLQGDVVLEGKTDVVIRGLYVRDGSIRVSNGRRVRIEGNTLAGGSIVIEGSTDVTVADNVLYAPGDAAGRGIAVRRSDRVAVSGNRIHNYGEALLSDRPDDRLAERNLVTGLVDHPDRDPNPRGRDLYVIQAIGRDESDGSSPGKAFRTLRKANAAARAGDRVFVGTGVYDEPIAPAASGQTDARIEFIAFQPGVVVSRGASVEKRDFITLEAFEFRGAGVKARDAAGLVVRDNLLFEAGLRLDDCRDFLVEGNRLSRSLLIPQRDNGGAGIWIEAGGPGVVRQNVMLFARNNGGIVGDWRDRRVHVRDVIFEGNFLGFHSEHGLTVGWARNLVIRRNVFCWGGNGNPYFGRNDIQDSKIYNNTWFRAGWYIQPYPDAVSRHRRNDFRNNIFAQDASQVGRYKFFTYMPLEPEPGQREFTLDYNLYFPDGIVLLNNSDRGIPDQPPPLSFETLKEWQEYSGDDRHSRVGDPEFLDPATLDFRLRPGSLAVDAGDPRHPVPAGGGRRVDIGAYELRQGD